MIDPPERSAERDAAVLAALAHVESMGWTAVALRAGLTDIGAHPMDAELLFPGGGIDLIEAFIDLADRQMETAEADPEFAALRLPARVRALIAARLAWLRPHRNAVRRSLGVLASPFNGRIAARATARSVDAIWHLAGDRSADFSWYTKRLILTGVYATTLLFWLRDHGEDDAATLAFLDRRLAAVRRIGQLRGRLDQAVARFRPAA